MTTVATRALEVILESMAISMLLSMSMFLLLEADEAIYTYSLAPKHQSRSYGPTRGAEHVSAILLRIFLFETVDCSCARYPEYEGVYSFGYFYRLA